MNYKNLFLKQSYIDSFDTYRLTLSDSPRRPQIWDYVILTASNESQAESYRAQIEYRKKGGFLPADTDYAVIPDFEGKRVGSGGATLGAMRYVFEKSGSFDNLKILVIHSGGDSKRVPQYSACGKLFSPVPRELPDGRLSTLFDEFIIAMSGVPGRIGSGMLVLSGDVLLLFNPLQIEFYGKGAAALSIKEDVETGKEHGVFLRGKEGTVSKFLHKQTVDTLRSAGAVDKSGKVNIDTGAVIFGSDVLKALYSIADTEENFRKYVNDKVRLSFYADFLYPLADDSSLENFYKEKPEGDFCKEFEEARTVLWNRLHGYSMKLLCLSPASFLHFGTSGEILGLLTDKIDEYCFLDWKRSNGCNILPSDYAVYNSYIADSAEIGEKCYIENSMLGENVKIGKGSIISGITLSNISIPENVVLHCLKLKDGSYCARMIAINDNPKESKWFGGELAQPLWTAPLFSSFSSPEDAAKATVNGVKGSYSLEESFNEADVTAFLPWTDSLADRIDADRFIKQISNFIPVTDLSDTKLTEKVKNSLIETAESSDFSVKIRIYYYLAKCTGDNSLYDKCFKTIAENIYGTAIGNIHYRGDLKFQKNEVTVRLPVRVNWGGGWSDTPPYCNENGGMVLNAAVTLNGELPIEVTIKRTEQNKIILASTDNGSYCEFDKIEQLQDSSDPADPFALHKAALTACGIIPRNRKIQVADICARMGGGLYFNTRVYDIPKGSGLGTSSILAAACVKGICEIFGTAADENKLFNLVMCMEQLMSTGGGWQDQAGGLIPGIKMISSEPGAKQNIVYRSLKISEKAKRELSERFCLIYTGQRRLARNLLREVVGKYIGADRETRAVLYRIQRIAVLMQFELEKGNIDGFCKLLNEHWEESKKLDSGCTNTCIDQIFLSIEDLIDGKMICGAGGGGFLQVMLKKGVKPETLKERLWSVFADSGVCLYSCEFYGL